MYSSKSWSVPASARLCPGRADTGGPSPRPMCLVAKSCPTLCDPMDLARQVSRPMGILQARILEWVACPPPGDLPKPRIDPGCPALQADSYGLSPRGSPLWWKPPGGRRKPKPNLGPGGLCQGGQTHLLGVGEETGRAIMGAHRVYSCPLDLFRFKPGRFEACMAVSPGALASVAGRGQENGTVSLGDRALTLGMR